MTDEQMIRNNAVSFALGVIEKALVSQPRNSHEFLELANDIAEFISSGALPVVP